MPSFTNLMMQTPKKNQMTPEMAAMAHLNNAEVTPEEEQNPLYQEPPKPSSAKTEAAEAKVSDVKVSEAQQSHKLFAKGASEMRRAIILKEILDKPLALRRR